MKQNKIISCTILLYIAISTNLYSQRQDKISFGINIIHFNDWEHKPLNFFNPEIKYLKSINPNSAINFGINAVYAQSASKDFQNPGDVFQRLILSADFAYKKYFNHFSGNIGPSVRYRNEKIRASCSSCPPWEFRIQPKKGFIDIGAAAGLNYEFLIKEKASFEITMAYRLYSKGVNPVSLGLFYNRHL